MKCHNLIGLVKVYACVSTDPSPRRELEDKAHQTAAKETRLKIQQGNGKNNLIVFFYTHEKETTNKAIPKHTRTHKHECVPFLLARSTFKGLSKNMASEEEAFQRKEKQSRLSASDLPLLQALLVAGPRPGPPQGAKHSPVQSPRVCPILCKLSPPEKNWEWVCTRGDSCVSAHL